MASTVSQTFDDVVTAFNALDPNLGGNVDPDGSSIIYHLHGSAFETPIPPFLATYFQEHSPNIKILNKHVLGNNVHGAGNFKVDPGSQSEHINYLFTFVSSNGGFLLQIMFAGKKT